MNAKSKNKSHDQVQIVPQEQLVPEVQIQDKIDRELAKFSTMSGKIRYLDSKGMTRGDIHRKLGIKYQWVRNVLLTAVTTPKEQFKDLDPEVTAES